MNKILFLLFCLTEVCAVSALDNSYHYSIDITKLSDRRLNVELIPPHLTENTIVFSLPKIVPGTYSIYDFGRFADGLKAFDAAGTELPVTHIDTNSWEIKNSAKLAKITYRIRDTYHADPRDNPIFEPAGTDFQPDTCYVLNLHTMLGYFRGHTRQPYELDITHQPTFYGSTSLTDADNSNTNDLYHIANYNEAVDNPIMYTQPDTAHLKVGESDILISVYSPSKKATAKGISIQLDTLLQDQGKYLGGKLPVQNYSFLIYLAKHEGMTGGFGALEHSYGSMYYLIDGDNNELASTVRNVASHEFFHIVTPLTIHSEEIANFDFDHPRMSEHLWLYEGSTEYHAHVVQVRYGLITKEEFLLAIKQAMTQSMFSFNDSLSFTEMSKGCLDTFKEQYNNVYAKGPLISMCLDLELLHLSDGKYGIMNLIQDLSKSYGKDRAFKDEELIPKIISLTYPGIKTFFDNYVEGCKPLPFEQDLAYAGIDYTRIKKTKAFSFGQCDLGFDPATRRMTVTGVSTMNDFGKAVGYQTGDEIDKVNGKKVTLLEFRNIRANWISHAREGDNFKVTVFRKTPDGKTSKKTLKTKVFKADVRTYNSIAYDDKPTEEQIRIRKAWLYGVN